MTNKPLKSWLFISVFLCVYHSPAYAASRGQKSAEPPLVVSCGAVGRELELCREGVERWAQGVHPRKEGKDGGKPEVQVISAPVDSGERLGLYQLQLAAESSDIDVFLVDTTWPGMMGDFFIDLRPQAPPGRLESYFKSFIDNNTVHGRLVALPWFMDAGLLYYRKDLLARYGENPPQTWQELTDSALRVQKAERAAGQSRFWGFVFEGRSYEGLTCNALEWVASAGGGTFVDAQGQVTINNPNAIRALTLASEWPGSISPPGVLNYIEEEARAVFQSGNALYLRNWPYAWKLTQAPDSPVAGKVSVSVLPAGGMASPAAHAATLGGWSLAVSRFSKNPRAAIELVFELTGRAELKRRAVEAGLNPTMPELYQDPEVLASNPISKQLLQVFESAVSRPARSTGSKYNRASAEIRDRVHQILAGGGKATNAPGAPEVAGQVAAQVAAQVKALETSLRRIGRDGKW